MNWFESTKLASYHLWEYTNHDNALDLWYCAEDISCYLEQANILDEGMMHSIQHLGVGSEGYIWFVRHIAYRLYLYSRNHDDLANWYTAEKLIEDLSWVKSITEMASMLRKDRHHAMEQLRSDQVKNFYKTQTF